MAPAYQEKRAFPRFKINTPLRFQLRGTAETSTTISDDLSAGGLGFISGRFLPLNAAVMLEFSLLSRTLRPIGRVAWSSPQHHSNRFRTGIQFIEFDPSQKRFLEECLKMEAA